MAILGLHGWCAGRAWLVLTVGLVVFACGDALYLLQITESTYVQGTAMDALWGAGLVLMALSAWQRAPDPRPGPPTGAVLAPPFGFALAALGVLVYAGIASAPRPRSRSPRARRSRRWRARR